MRTHPYAVPLLAALLPALVGAQIAMVFKVPSWGNDEPAHTGYVAALAEGRLPTIETDIVDDPDRFPGTAGEFRGWDEDHGDIWTANHPPLFHPAMVPVWWVASEHQSGMIITMRLANTLGFAVWLFPGGRDRARAGASTARGGGAGDGGRGGPDTRAAVGVLRQRRLGVGVRAAAGPDDDPDVAWCRDPAPAGHRCAGRDGGGGHPGPGRADGRVVRGRAAHRADPAGGVARRSGSLRHGRRHPGPRVRLVLRAQPAPVRRPHGPERPAGQVRAVPGGGTRPDRQHPGAHRAHTGHTDRDRGRAGARPDRAGALGATRRRAARCGVGAAVPAGTGHLAERGRFPRHRRRLPRPLPHAGDAAAGHGDRRRHARGGSLVAPPSACDPGGRASRLVGGRRVVSGAAGVAGGGAGPAGEVLRVRPAGELAGRRPVAGRVGGAGGRCRGWRSSRCWSGGRGRPRGPARSRSRRRAEWRSRSACSGRARPCPAAARCRRRVVRVRRSGWSP
ncbi:hypothetical protein [Nocardioides sp. B-3]|uniref:hypothetical protein n=1 Tax=Nocardioides sp. B-3 TaxID=2895565 RepID=UPI0021520F66|nr:hypothetical protein [Nocardioides sp. B-3]UUZ59988.1 hypothetical protein LP418_02925 [Nocardioides sp. B-3]